jgi:hypothetical protein
MEAGFLNVRMTSPISYSRIGLADHCRPVAAVGPVCQAFDSVDLTCCPVAVDSVDSAVSWYFSIISRRFLSDVPRVLMTDLDWWAKGEVA